MLKIGIITPNDLVKRLPFGGGSGFILNVLTEMKSETVVFGGGANGTPTWMPEKMSNRVTFVPTYNFEFPSTRSLRVIALKGYLKARKRILGSGVSLLYIHSPECALPFLFFNRRIPIVFHQHGSGNPAMLSRYDWARSKYSLAHWFFDRLHGMIYRRADWIIAIDRLCLEQAREGGAVQKTSLIMNAVDTKKFRPDREAGNKLRAQAKIQREQSVILFAGRIEAVKNIDSLIEAVRLLDSEGLAVLLILAGDGSLRAVMEKRVRQNDNLRRIVHFLGKVDHDDLPSYYNMADVLALTSHMEGVPMVVMEALSCGTPVVATRVGGIPDIVKNGINGCLVADGSPHAIAEGLKSALMSQYDEERIAKSVERWSAENVAVELETLFVNLTAK